MTNRELKTAGQILLIPAGDVIPDTFSIRNYDNDNLYNLTESIKEIGIISPLTVKYDGHGKYTVISGERRRRAAAIAGIKYLPCVLIASDGLSLSVIRLAENINRKNIHYVDFSSCLSSLLKFINISEISSFLSLPEDTVLSYIKLQGMSDNIKNRFINENIDEKDALYLCNTYREDLINIILDIKSEEKCSIVKAEQIHKENKKREALGFYNDITVFTNSVEKAVRIMQSSGINAEFTKDDSGAVITYTVKINKLRLKLDKLYSVRKLGNIQLVSGENP